MTQTELTKLIQGARTGDRQAQETLLAEIQNRVYYHCKKMLKHDSDAQDATQDVLITVLTSLDKLREPAAFYGWVNGITANRCKHLLTQGGREWQIPENEDGDSMLDNLEDLDQQAVPDAVLDNKETQRLMMELIDALPPEQRMSVLFYYYDEMSVKEIAQAMETTEGTVKSRLNYARKSIKAGVEDLERRGTKLYSIAPLPLLLLLFLRKDASQSGMTAAQSAQVSAAVFAAARSGSAGAGMGAGAKASVGSSAKAAGSTAAKAGMSLGAKIAAGVLAAVAAVGIAFGVTQLMKPDRPPQVEDEPPARSEQRAEREPEPEPEPEGPSPELLALLDSIVYYGDKSRCRLTAEQAAAYAEVLRQETNSLVAEALRQLAGQSPAIHVCAALFDVGDGTPALFFGGGVLSTYELPMDGSASWVDVGTLGIWQYQDGQAVPYAPEGMEPGGYWGQALALRDGHLFIGGQRGSDGTQYNAGVYPLTGSAIPTTPLTSAGYEPKDLLLDPYDLRCTVDGAEVPWETFEQWCDQWEKQPNLCGHYWDGGVGGRFTGLGDATATADALAQYADGTIAVESGFFSDLPKPGAPAARPYAQPYTQKVRELLDIDPSLTFDLVYIDEDDIPELLVDLEDVDTHWISLYTFSDGNVYTLAEDLLVGLRDYLGYYPRENLVERSSAELNFNQWDTSDTYYHISGEHELKRGSDSREPLGELQYLRGSLSGLDILAELES